jgi:hypothetical protein
MLRQQHGTPKIVAAHTRSDAPTLYPFDIPTVLLKGSEYHLPERYGKNSALLAGFKKQRKIITDWYLGDEAAVSISDSAFGSNRRVGLGTAVEETITLDTMDPEAVPVVFCNALSNHVDGALLCGLVRWNRV